MRPLGLCGLPVVAATMAAVTAGAPAAAATAEHLIALAPTLEAAGRLATLQSLRAPVEPAAVFPVRGRVDWGEADARFGAWRGGHVHEGQDVFAPAGTPLLAMRDGRVVETGNDGGRGNYVAMWSRAARRTFVYLHMLHPSRLRVGKHVRAGQRVGAVGCTGSCSGDHLHLEVRVGSGTAGRPLDPLPLLRRLAARARSSLRGRGSDGAAESPRHGDPNVARGDHGSAAAHASG
jgi:murein DD-endopeptidase MepM/ murein hydrolase activator NlpD